MNGKVEDLVERSWHALPLLIYQRPTAAEQNIAIAEALDVSQCPFQMRCLRKCTTDVHTLFAQPIRSQIAALSSTVAQLVDLQQARDNEAATLSRGINDSVANLGTLKASIESLEAAASGAAARVQ